MRKKPLFVRKRLLKSRDPPSSWFSPLPFLKFLLVKKKTSVQVTLPSWTAKFLKTRLSRVHRGKIQKVHRVFLVFVSGMRRGRVMALMTVVRKSRKKLVRPLTLFVSEPVKPKLRSRVNRVTLIVIVLQRNILVRWTHL